MKISVIIPVFNVEKYLKQCVDSVLNQSYKNFEIILVDDGSTDSSGQMCDEFSQKDERICVVHKENGGLSDARNVGISVASGDYMMFLDSDDYWDTKKCLEIVVSKLEQTIVDMLTFRYKKYIESEKKYIDCLPSLDENEVSGIVSKNEILTCLLKNGLYISSACNKVLRTKFVKENNLYFRKGITSEDIDWCARCMLYAQNIVYSNIDSYVYRQREASISHSLGYKNIYDLKNNIIECVKLGQNIEKKDPFYNIYYTFVAYQYGVFLLSNNLVRDADVTGLVEEMRQYRWLLKFHANKKIKILYYIDKFLGYQNIAPCMRLYSRIRKG